jgi:nucleoside-diphosphate-sugar epimerase
MKQVLLTGATGKLGPHVLQALVDRRCTVRVATPDRPAHHPDTHWVEVDLRHDVDWAALVEGCDTVIHLAAELRDIHRMERVNVHATEHLARAAEAAGVPVFLYTSSVGAYGFTKEALVTERTSTMGIEDVAARDFFAGDDLFQYARSKLRGELVLRQVLRKTRCVVVRPANIVTAKDIEKILEWPLMRRLWRGHRCTHQVYVKDVAEAVAWLSARAHQEHSVQPDIYNVSSDHEETNCYADLFSRAVTLSGRRRLLPGIRMPAALDVWKDRLKFRRYDVGLPPGLVRYSPEKLMQAGFVHPHGILKVQDEVIRARGMKP